MTKSELKIAKKLLGYSPAFKSLGHMHILNPSLLQSKNIDKRHFRELRRIHRKKDRVLEKMKITEDSSELRKLAKQVTQLEFHLQRLWGFPEDVNYHKGWLLPGCSCPAMDWADAYPFESHHNSTCPIHGCVE